MGGKSGVVLYAREALLLGRRDDLAVTDQAGGTVMIISGYPEDIYRLHSLPEFSDVMWFFYRYFHKLCQSRRSRRPDPPSLGTVRKKTMNFRGLFLIKNAFPD